MDEEGKVNSVKICSGVPVNDVFLQHGPKSQVSL